MQQPWRLLDTPPMSAADNICLNEVLTELKGEGTTPNTLRFLQFSPHTVLVGYHQCVKEEIRADYCRKHGIDINRRITGGSAIYCNENQLGWEIYADKSFFGFNLPCRPLFERLCAPAAAAIRDLGIPDAAFRPRNDIEIRGRKISGTGGTESGQAFMFQGTLLVDFDVDTMLKALRIPAEKLKHKEAKSVRERVTCLKWELGYLPDMTDIKNAIRHTFQTHLGIHVEESGLTREETELFEKRRGHFHSNAWINKINPKIEKKKRIQTSYKSLNGLVRFSLTVDMKAKRVRDLYITGDFLSFPARALYDLESELRGAKLDRGELHAIIKNYFDTGRLTIPDIEFEDFIKPLDQALAKVEIAESGLSMEEAERIFLTNGSFKDILALKPSVLLLPYCAKPTDCELRHTPGCKTCGRPDCTVGKAWELGGKKGLRRTTVVSYENLWEELMRMKRREEKAFIGICCRSFFAKHIDDFERAGVPGILIDINDCTCYELDKAKEAYAGTFAGQTSLDIDLMKQVLEIETP